MSISATEALSPLDGRYAGKLGDVRRIFSEAGLMRERVRVECAWFVAPKRICRSLAMPHAPG
jgi:adenylosuccinate lyase